MVKQTIILLIFTSMIIVLTGCTTKCDDFDYNIVDWMPYKVNDKIVISKNSNRDTLTVNSSVIEHTDKQRFGKKCGCENSFNLNLSSDTLNIDIIFWNTKLIEYSEIVINGEPMYYSEQLDSLNLNGQAFIDLIIYENMNQLSSRKIIVAKSIGIIAIIKENDEWIIIDDSKKQIIASEIELISSGC